MYSIVEPAVTNTFTLDFILTLLFPILLITNCTTRSAEITFALSSDIDGSSIDTPNDFNFWIFSVMMIFSYIASCIAGAITIGILDPKPTLNTVVTGLSSIPFANFPKVLAVHGYTRIRSDLP
jgi:hypothetical protein